MTAIRSTKTTSAEDMTAKPALRGRRAIVAAAAVVACSLLAAPLQAEHETFDVTVTLTATPGDGEVTLQASHGVDSHVGAQSLEIVGYQFRGQSNGEWDDDWWHMYADGSGYVRELTNGTAYTFQARAYRATSGDDGYHYAYSDPSESVTVTPTASTE